jgi:hypothetical protein
MQARADAMEGPRYYLPRPHLVLKAPVPVAARSAFVSFTFDADRRLFVLSVPPEAEWVRAIVPETLTISQALAVRIELDQAGRQQSTSPTTSPSDGGTEQDGAQGAARTPPSTVESRVGFINGEDPVTRLNDLFDVVYLPDFDEQYVVRRRAVLGTSDFQMRLRNGWAAETFGEQFDNSNLIPYVIEQVESASAAALNVATQWGLRSVGVPATSVPVAPPATPAGQQQGATPEQEERAALDLLGNLVLLKVVEIRTAQPGLYPILKPREVYDWFGGPADRIASGTAGDAGLRSLLAAKGLAWIRPDQVFVPAPPVTMVGFNTTSNVFLAPANKEDLGIAAVRASADRHIGGGSGPAGVQGETEVPDPLAGAFRGALRSRVPEVVAGKVNVDRALSIQVAGNRTTFTFRLPQATTQPFTGPELAEDLWTGWFRSSFELAAGQDITVEPSQDRTQVVVWIAATPDQLRPVEP